MARKFFANEDPIGKRIVVGRVSPTPREIVGIVADVHGRGLDLPLRQAVFLPGAQDPLRDFALMIRSAADPRALAGPARAAGEPW